MPNGAQGVCAQTANDAETDETHPDLDQGKEMSAHRLFTKKTGMQVCFAHPRSPWERGANENANGLIRRRFPKGADFNQVSAYEVRKAQDRLNGRPRNASHWKTPFEAFNELLHRN